MSQRPDESDPLDPLLDRWGKTVPHPPGHVTPEVWRRIALRKTPAQSAGWIGRLHAIFARPSFAVAFVAACVLLGLFLAEMQVSRQQADYGAKVAQSYLRLIDPLLAAGTGPEASSAKP